MQNNGVLHEKVLSNIVCYLEKFMELFVNFSKSLFTLHHPLLLQLNEFIKFKYTKDLSKITQVHETIYTILCVYMFIDDKIDCVLYFIKQQINFRIA